MGNANDKLDKTKKSAHVSSDGADREYCKLFNCGNLEENIIVVQCIKIYA